MPKTPMRVVFEHTARLPHAFKLRHMAVASVLGAGLMVGLTVVGAESASATGVIASAYGTAAQTVTAVVQNGSITVVVHGLTPGETVMIYIASTPTLLGPATASSTGVVNATFPLPAGLAAGMHTVTVLGAGTNLSAAVYLTSSTTPAANLSDPPPDPAPPATQLPHTGADVATPTALGAVLVAGGGMLVLWSRKRRRTPLAG